MSASLHSVSRPASASGRQRLEGLWLEIRKFRCLHLDSDELVEIIASVKFAAGNLYEHYDSHFRPRLQEAWCHALGLLYSVPRDSLSPHDHEQLKILLQACVNFNASAWH